MIGNNLLRGEESIFKHTHKSKKQLDLVSEHTYLGFVFYAPPPLTHKLYC